MKRGSPNSPGCLRLRTPIIIWTTETQLARETLIIIITTNHPLFETKKNWGPFEGTSSTSCTFIPRRRQCGRRYSTRSPSLRVARHRSEKNRIHSGTQNAIARCIGAGTCFLIRGGASTVNAGVAGVEGRRRGLLGGLAHSNRTGKYQKRKIRSQSKHPQKVLRTRDKSHPKSIWDQVQPSKGNFEKKEKGKKYRGWFCR